MYSLNEPDVDIDQLEQKNWVYYFYERGVAKISEPFLYDTPQATREGFVIKFHV